MSVRKYICVECGHPQSQIFKQFSHKLVVMATCTNCGKFVDKYVEYDTVLISLDLLIHRIEAYRHMLYNQTFIVNFYKLFFLSIIIEGYIGWGMEQSMIEHFTPDHIIHAALQTMFYAKLLEKVFLSVGLFLCYSLFLHVFNIDIDYSLLLKMLTFTGFSRLFVLPVIWWRSQLDETFIGNRWIDLRCVDIGSFLYVVSSFFITVSTNFQGVRALCNIGVVQSLLINAFICLLVWTAIFFQGYYFSIRQCLL